jgi:hypothetical protein
VHPEGTLSKWETFLHKRVVFQNTHLVFPVFHVIPTKCHGEKMIKIFKIIIIIIRPMVTDSARLPLLVTYWPPGLSTKNFVI